MLKVFLSSSRRMPEQCCEMSHDHFLLQSFKRTEYNHIDNRSSRNSVVKYGTVHPSQKSEETNMDIKCHPNCRHVFVNMNCFLKRI